MSFSSTRHHTERLVRDGQVESFPYKGKVRLFPKGVSYSEKILISEARGKSAAAVLRGIVEDGLKFNSEISNSTGLARSTVSKYVHLFMKLGVVHKTMSPQGRMAYAPEGQVTNLLKLGSSGLSKTIDNYLELWDF